MCTIHHLSLYHGTLLEGAGKTTFLIQASLRVASEFQWPLGLQISGDLFFPTFLHLGWDVFYLRCLDSVFVIIDLAYAVKM